MSETYPILKHTSCRVQHHVWVYAGSVVTTEPPGDFHCTCGRWRYDEAAKAQRELEMQDDE